MKNTIGVLIVSILLNTMTSHSQQLNFDEKEVIQSFKNFAMAYDLRKHKIDPLVNKGNYKDALPYALEAFKYDPYISGTLAHCYMAIGDIENAYKYAVQSFKVGWHTKYYDQDVFTDSKLWNSIQKHYDSLDKAGKIVHIENDTLLSNKICAMIDRDQQIRKSYLAYEKSENPIKTTLDSFEKQMNYIDATNIQELTTYVNQNGYPNEKTLDPMCEINTLLLHTELSNSLYFIPLLKQAALQNNNTWLTLMSTIYHITFRMKCYDKTTQQNKLLFITNNNKGEIDIDASFIQIYTMVDILKDNPYASLELFAYKEENTDYKQAIKNLEKLQAVFIQFDINKERVKILSELQTARDGFLQQYKSPYGMFHYQNNKKL